MSSTTFRWAENLGAKIHYEPRVLAGEEIRGRFMETEDYLDKDTSTYIKWSIISQQQDELLWLLDLQTDV